MPLVTTVWDTMPPVRKFDPKNPPDVKTLQLTLDHIEEDNTLKNTYRHRRDRYYTNGYYSIDVCDEYKGASRTVIWFYFDKGNQRFKLNVQTNYLLPKSQENSQYLKSYIRLAKNATGLNRFFEDYSIEENIALKTLYDLNRILLNDYGWRCLTVSEETNIKNRLELE